MKKYLSPFFVCCLAFSGSVVANEYLDRLSGDAENEYDDSQDVPWQEDQLGDLAVPDTAAMKKLDIDRKPVGFDIYIDLETITVSESDRVVRYWLMLKAGKSQNTMYEGMRCDDRQFKTYAYVNKWDKKKINTNKTAQWQAVKNLGHVAYRNELLQYYFCSGVLPRPVKDIKDIIKGYKTTLDGYDPTFHYAN